MNTSEDFTPRWRKWWDARYRAAIAEEYFLTRFIILRLLGFVYLAAFVSLIGQMLPLIGSEGLLPAAGYLERVTSLSGSTGAAFWKLPTIFYLGASDSTLVFFAWFGLFLAVVVLFGFANSIIMLVLWAIYMSFVHIGQTWYGYGWEIELLENGFLAVFLCPFLDGRPFSKRPTPLTLIVLYRWLAFRIMFGAGMIKIRGDDCWRELSCLQTHYETQPIPNPLSPYLHFMPAWFHTLGVLFNHLVELILPFFVFGPRRLRLLAGVLLVLFQFVLIVSGNLSFLNWLTIVPILACFDDRFLKRLLPNRFCLAATTAAKHEFQISKPRKIAVAMLALMVSVLSINPISNLFSGQQVMNTSFDSFALVNTYGAFGSVGKVRHEIIFEGTTETKINKLTRWRAYEFPCKPGDPQRRPCITGPYQRRLDWQIWFAAMSYPQREPWTVHLIWKLLHNDAGALSLLDGNPFPDEPPHAIRATLYRYEFAAPDNISGAWWKRERVRSWLPPMTRDDERLLEFLKLYGWQ